MEIKSVSVSVEIKALLFSVENLSLVIFSGYSSIHGQKQLHSVNNMVWVRRKVQIKLQLNFLKSHPYILLF